MRVRPTATRAPEYPSILSASLQREGCRSPKLPRGAYNPRLQYFKYQFLGESWGT